MRLNQLIAARSHLSRRTADSAITSGRVTVDGLPAVVGQSVGPEAKIRLDGQLLTEQPLAYIALHKPVGYVCSRAGQGSATVYQLLPPELRHLKTVGRLDKDSSGLLVLTNDGRLTQRLTHPSLGKLKVYNVNLDHPLSPQDRRQLEAGVELADGPSRLQLAGRGNSWQVSLSEGRNRQIRRSFAALGYRVLMLQRRRFGDLELGDLPAGHWQTIGRDQL